LIFDGIGQHAYLLNELNSTLIVYQYDSEIGSFSQLQILPTLPEAFAGENYCSDLHLSSDGRFLYISNRGHNSLVCFRVDASTGMLTYQSHVASGGNYPRIFAIHPSGRFLLVAHQKPNNVVVFQVDSVTGALSPTGHEAQVSMPVHVLFG
jgi:6-phosphogluconolactonase